jgi:hypothetical protein
VLNLPRPRETRIEIMHGEVEDSDDLLDQSVFTYWMLAHHFGRELSYTVSEVPASSSVTFSTRTI